MVTQPGNPAADSGQPPRQRQVYRAYLALQSIAATHFSGSLAGRLVLSVDFALHGAEAALATTIAGGAFLGIEPDSAKLKVALRNGSCDFMVNTLDEALRVLKNELRKGTPLSAGLVGYPAEILPAMVKRGVQPNLIADSLTLDPAEAAIESSPQKQDPPTDAGQAPWHPAMAILFERGAHRLGTGGNESLPNAEVVWTAANPQDLRRMDKIALDWLPVPDTVRRRWLEQAPGYFYRQAPLERVLGLAQGEWESLWVAFEKASASAAFQSPVMVQLRLADGSEQIIPL